MERSNWDERYASEERLWSAKPNASLVAVAAALPPGHALDLGCGEGADAIWLAERGWAVTAVDFSAVALGRARERADRAGLRLDWIEADLRAYVPPPASFDLVALLYIHLPPTERQRILARACTSLAPGGTLLVVGHDRSNPPEAHGPRNPDVLFTPEEIAADLPGLTIARAERIERAEGSGARAVDTLVVASARP